MDPVGRQVPLDTLPMSTALSPDGKYLLVLNGGYRPPSVSVIETASGRVTGSVPVADGWLGLAISPKGDTVYVGGGSKASIFEFAFANGVAHPRADLRRRCRRRSAARRISSATWPSRPTAACSTPPTSIAIASRWSIRNPAW